MRRTASWMAVAAISLATATSAGCNDRISQCNSLISVINEEQGKHADLNGDNAESFRKLGDALDETARRVGDVPIKDEKLKAFRADYKTICEDFAKAAREAAAGGDDQKKHDEAVKAMQSIGPREDKLVNDINAFCQGT